MRRLEQEALARTGQRQMGGSGGWSGVAVRVAGLDAEERAGASTLYESGMTLVQVARCWGVAFVYSALGKYVYGGLDYRCEEG